MQKHIKSVMNYLISQQQNIIKGAVVITGLILVYALLFLPTPVVQNEAKETSAISVEDPNVVDVEVVENTNVVESIEEETPEVVMIPSKKDVSVASNKAMGTVKSFFDSYNSKDFGTACGLLSSAKCDPESTYAVNRLAAEYDKMENGYENVSVWLAEDTEGFHSDVVCVKYSYQYRGDVNKKKISERMSFYVQADEDGQNKITNRVCEKKFAETIGDVPCPILSKRDFCLE